LPHATRKRRSDGAPQASFGALIRGRFCGDLPLRLASTIPLDLIGLKRRRLLGHGWVLVLTPLYWFLLSRAAWRALIQLICDPQRWEKTEHGLARTSRLQVQLSTLED
jgi:hypothetical protein